MAIDVNYNLIAKIAMAINGPVKTKHLSVGGTMVNRILCDYNVIVKSSHRKLVYKGKLRQTHTRFVGFY